MQPVQRDQPKFFAVGTMVNIALSMLEHERGKKGLVAIGNGVIAEIHPDKRVYKDGPEDMPDWVDTFLQKLRGSFPPVVLNNSLDGEGQLRRSNWAAGGRRMQDWDPKDAGLMRLNQLVCYLSRIKSTSNPSQDYQRYDQCRCWAEHR